VSQVTPGSATCLTRAEAPLVSRWSIATGLFAVGLTAIVSCEHPPSWYDQVEPSGPCYEANLLDGLDEGSSLETHAVFDCLNQQGNLEPLAGLVSSIDETNRLGEANNAPIARLVNSTISTDMDPFSMLAQAGDTMEQNSEDIEQLLQALVEQIYGEPFSSIDRTDSGLSSENGTVLPIIRSLRPVASALIDDDLAGLAPVKDALTSETILSALHTILGAARGDITSLNTNAERLPELFGDFLSRTQSPNNDIWTGASGDSLIDLIDRLLSGTNSEGASSLQALNTPMNRIAGDTTLGREVESVILELSEDNRLHSVGLQIQYLANVDTNGGALSRGEDTALVSALRLLSNGNQSFDCSLDLWITDLEFSFGNLSQTLLRAFSDEGAANTGVDLIGSILGGAVSESVLYLLADSGLCPAFDSQMVDDLHAIDRLNDPETADLLAVLVQMLLAVDEGGNSSKLSEVIDLLSIPERHGWNQPISELMRDTAGTLLVGTGINLIEAIVAEPEGIEQSGFPEGTDVLGFQTIWRTLKSATDNSFDGTSGILALESPFVALFGSGEFSTASSNLARLLSSPNSSSRNAMDWLSEVVAFDSELSWRHTLADTLLTEENTRDLALLLENQAFISGLSERHGDLESPVEWLANLQITGAFESIIFLTDWLLSTMGAVTTSD
jgi:hypothetical protein